MRGVPCVSILGVVDWAGILHLLCVIVWEMPPASPRCCVPWSVGRSWTRASHNSGRPINLLIDRNGPRCKKAHTKVPAVLCRWLGEGDASLTPFHRSQRLQCLCRKQHHADTRSSLELRVVIWVCLEGVFLEWVNIRGGCSVSGCWRAEHSRGMLLITHVHPLIYRHCYWFCFGYTWMETHPVLPTYVFSSCRWSRHYFCAAVALQWGGWEKSLFTLDLVCYLCKLWITFFFFRFFFFSLLLLEKCPFALWQIVNMLNTTINQF